MRKILTLSLIIILAIGIFLSGCAPTPPPTPPSPPKPEAPKGPTGDPIKFGAVLPLADITGKQASKAMLLAVKEINAAGGVLGRPLEVVIADDEAKGEKGAAAIDKLATVDNVYAFIGGMSSGVHMAQLPVLKKYAKPTVWIGAAASVVIETPMAEQSWYFHLHPWDYQQTGGYIDGFKEIMAKNPQIQLKKWFIGYEEGAFGTAGYKGFQVLWPEQGWEVSGASFKSALLGGGDYRAALRQAKDYKPDAYLWLGYDADALPMLEQAKEIGFAPPMFIGAPPGWPADFGKSPLAEGVSLFGMWAPSLKEVSTASKHFWEAYNAEFNEAPATYFAPLGYTNVYVVANAINKAGSLDQDKVIAALNATKYDSPVGETLTIAPSRTLKTQGFTKQKILQWQKGVQQVIWPFGFKTAELAYPFPAWDKR
jgi:branched-chain amino acid transport system substrate-binding protein